jgi:hypothetical protein
MKRNKTYELVREFVRKYPMTIAWRIWQHSLIVEKFLNDDEEVVYAFAGQENDNYLDIITTCVVALTNQRILIGRKRLLWGYFYHSITPDMFNDMEIKTGILWGKLSIDTIKELVVLSNLDLKSLPELEEAISENVAKLKKEWGSKK